MLISSFLWPPTGGQGSQTKVLWFTIQTEGQGSPRQTLVDKEYPLSEQKQLRSKRNGWNMESDLVLPGNNSALGHAQDRRTGLGVSERPWQRSPAQPSVGRPPPTPVRKGTHPPRAHTQALPRAAGRPRPPLSTPRLKVAVVERKRGEAGAGPGVPGYQETGS